MRKLGQAEQSCRQFVTKHLTLFYICLRASSASCKQDQYPVTSVVHLKNQFRSQGAHLEGNSVQVSPRCQDALSGPQKSAQDLSVCSHVCIFINVLPTSHYI